MSCSTNAYRGLPRWRSALSRRPVSRLSTDTTSSPRSSSRSTRWLPMKPAPPSTIERITSPFRTGPRGGRRPPRPASALPARGRRSGASSVGRHHGCGRAQLALDVLAEAVGGIPVPEGADAHPVPGALQPQVRLDDVWLQPGAARLPFQASGLTALPRSPHLHGVLAEVARRRRERDRGGDLEDTRRLWNHGRCARSGCDGGADGFDLLRRLGSIGCGCPSGLRGGFSWGGGGPWPAGGIVVP